MQLRRVVVGKLQATMNIRAAVMVMETARAMVRETIRMPNNNLCWDDRPSNNFGSHHHPRLLHITVHRPYVSSSSSMQCDRAARFMQRTK